MKKVTTTKDLIAQAEELGYTVIYLLHEEWGTEININCTEWRGYTPEIYSYREADYIKEGNKERYWKVQTTSYGALEVNEIDKVIEGLQNGKKMAEILNSTDLTQLEEYRMPREE